VAISAFNALTLTPALSALLLRHSEKAELGKGAFFGIVERIIHGGTNGYVRIVGGLMRLRWGWSCVHGAAGRDVFRLHAAAAIVLPEEDAGYFITIVQAPAGSSLQYTSEVAKQAETVLSKIPEADGVFSVTGFSFTGSAPNQALIFVPLKSFDERKGDEHRLPAILQRARGQLFAIQNAFVIPFAPPSIQGLGAFGGFTVRGARPGRRHRHSEPRGSRFWRDRRLTESQRVTGLFSAFQANNPQLAVDIDREKARSLGLPISEITNAMQIYLGSAYVNDFDLNNRAYRVYVQAGQAVPRRSAGTRSVLRTDQYRSNGAACQRRPREGDNRAPGDQPLQPVPLGGDQRIGIAWRQLGPGHSGDGAARVAGAAAGIRLRVVGDFARRNQGRASVDLHLRHRAAPRVSDARRAV
jgi:HAE1 family hydrophobic/amphiphilic exporter-1